MKKAIRAVCFSLVLLVFFYPFIISKEYFSLQTIVKLQSISDNFVYGPRYHSQTPKFKYLSILENSPSVIALGTSRVLQIRDLFFEDPDVFYNAGHGVYNINEFSNFVMNFEDEQQPEVIIIGLDQNFFSSEWNKSEAEVYVDLSAGNGTPVDFKTTVIKMTQDMLEGDYKYSDFFNAPFTNIGINVFHSNNATRADGSVDYGNYLDASITTEERMQVMLTELEAQAARFEQCSQVNESAYIMVENFLDLCEQKGIHVIAYMPPYAPTINDVMATKDYSYIGVAIDELERLFSEYDHEFYDYTDIRNLDCDDSYFTDGLHAGEVAHAKMQLDMINQGSVLKDYSNVELLQALYENRISNLELK